ncbi:MAG: DUF4397 domain-containing protein [Gemmatimonadota bacterium]|nr:DUF4397 domain-containing protein [Gemmatimonadota bacterium]
MKVYRLLPVALAALFAGCSGDTVSTLVTPAPHAAIRWINAVPDTMPMDYRVVDVVTNANEPNIAYRGSSGAYRQVPPGQHHIRVFPSGSTAAACNGPSVVSQILLDTTLTFNVNHYYTILHAGYMKTGASPQQRLIVTDDAFPANAAGKINIRIGNAFAGASDVFVTPAAAAGGAVTPPAAFSALAFGAYSPYTSFATAPTTPAASSYRVTATGAGTTTPLLADGLLPVGTPAFVGSTTVPPLNAVAGTQQDGSVLTSIVTPPSGTYTLTSSGSASSCPAAGTKTVVAAGTTGAVITFIDKNPSDPLLGQ